MADVDEANRLLDEAGFTRRGRIGPLQIGLLFQAEASSLIDLLVPALADVGVELVPESTEGPGGPFPRKFMGITTRSCCSTPDPSGPRVIRTTCG